MTSPRWLDHTWSGGFGWICARAEHSQRGGSSSKPPLGQLNSGEELRRPLLRTVPVPGAPASLAHKIAELFYGQECQQVHTHSRVS